MSSQRRDFVAMILKFLEDENLKETTHMLEQESGLFFDLTYFEELVMDGKWSEVENYLSGFTKVEDNYISTKIYFDIRKQKYLEALERREYEKAVEILMKDLKIFSHFNNELYKEMTVLLTFDDFRKHKPLANYGDTRSARASILREIKKGIKVNPIFHGKMKVPITNHSLSEWISLASSSRNA